MTATEWIAIALVVVVALISERRVYRESQEKADWRMRARVAEHLLEKEREKRQ